MVQAGSYRRPLVEGLRGLNEEGLANDVESKKIKLATASSMRGAVERLDGMTELFIDALEAKRSEYPEIVEHYSRNLKEGDAIPVKNNCAEINRRNGYGNRYYSSGELFLTT